MIYLDEEIKSVENEKIKLVKDFEERTDIFKLEILAIKDQQLGSFLRNSSKNFYSPVKNKQLFKSSNDYLPLPLDAEKYKKNTSSNVSETIIKLISPKRTSQIEKQMTSSILVNSPENHNKNESVEIMTSSKLKNINDLIFNLEKNIPEFKKNFQGLLTKLNRNNGNFEKIENEITNVEDRINQKFNEFKNIEKDFLNY